MLGSIHPYINSRGLQNTRPKPDTDFATNEESPADAGLSLNAIARVSRDGFGNVGAEPGRRSIKMAEL